MIKDNTKYTIYILELEKGKYYVGRTEYKKNRINDHFLGRVVSLHENINLKSSTNVFKLRRI